VKSYALKNSSFALLAAIIALILCNCINPISISTFIEDERVQEIIGGRVKIYYPGSDENLIPGNKRIYGLNPNRYYMVDIQKPDSSFEFIGFVTKSGNRSNKLEDIGRVHGGEIINLINDETYLVPFADPIINDTVLAFTPVDPEWNNLVTNGVITFPSGTTSMNVTNILTETPGTEWETVKVDSANDTELVTITANQILLEGDNTITDYIFVQKNITSENILKFLVLRVVIQGISELEINLTPYALPTTITPNPDTPSSSIDILQIFDPVALKTRTFTIGNAATANLSNFRWIYNGIDLATLSPGAVTLNTANGVAASSIIIDFSHNSFTDAELNREGTYIMTVQATDPGGMLWSSNLEVIITNN